MKHRPEKTFISFFTTRVKRWDLSIVHSENIRHTKEWCMFQSNTVQQTADLLTTNVILKPAHLVYCSGDIGPVYLTRCATNYEIVEVLNIIISDTSSHLYFGLRGVQQTSASRIKRTCSVNQLQILLKLDFQTTVGAVY